MKTNEAVHKNKVSTRLFWCPKKTAVVSKPAFLSGSMSGIAEKRCIAKAQKADAR